MFEKIVLCALSIALGLLVRGAETAARTDGEVWNEGVTHYRAGDVTNALRVLRPLMLSKTHGARAAEVVAKLAYDKARAGEARNPIKDLEEAAAAAQIALRAAPGDARLNRNFTRAVDGLPELRETARINAVLQAAQGKDPAALLRGAARDVRGILVDAGTYRTNAAPVVVALADALAARAEKAADAWIPVKEAICQAVTNQEQAATIALQVDQARAKTEKAARALGDLSEDAYALIADAEHDFTRFMKLTIAPPEAMQEDFEAQTNAYRKAEMINGRAWQTDALDFTRAFRARFPAWAKAYEQQAQADTNKPPFTAEAQAKVSALSTELEKMQLALCEKGAAEQELEAMKLIREILELLPNQGGGGQGQQQQNQNQNQQKNEPNKDKSKQDPQNQQDQQQDQSPDQRQEENPQEEEDESQDGEETKEEPEDREVDSVLRKAQERSDEHEADKRARMRKAPLPPNTRDW